MGLSKWVVLGWALTAPLCCWAASPKAPTTFFSIQDFPDGRRETREVPAQVTFPPGMNRGRVEIESVSPDGKKQPRVEHVSLSDLRRAQNLLNQQNLLVAMPNGGMLWAKPNRSVILEQDNQIQVGIEVFLEDGLPSSDVSRELKVLRSVHPLSAITAGVPVDPLAEGLLEQKFLMGAAPLHWERASLAPYAWPAVPVLIFNARVLKDGSEMFLVAEKRDLIDPTVKLARIYLVPKHRIRLPQSDWDYERHLANLTDPDLNKSRMLLRQQVFFPWTHTILSFQDEEPELALESDQDRFVRRAYMVLAWLEKQSDDDPGDLRPGTSRHRCADFLYEESQP